MGRWNQSQIRGFADAAQSLKLYRRAELLDDETQKSLVEDLYADPLPANGMLTALLRPNTSFLIGRKGTGKSTVFQRAQHEIRKQKNSISAYLDIKTIFESSDADPVLLETIGQQSAAMPATAVQQLLLYEAFIRAVLLEIRSEIKKQIDASFLSRLREKLLSSSNEIFEALDELIENSRQATFVDITGYKAVNENNEVQENASSSARASAKSSATIKSGLPAANMEVAASAATERGSSNTHDETFSKVFLRTFNIKGLIGELADLLSQIGIVRLYIFIDDFSELPEEAMNIFVDSILAPLNNWSNELIKFKVGA